MSIEFNDVQVGAFFITSTKELRKVTQLTTDPESRTRVNYISKSASIPGRAFNYPHTKSNPPLIETFVSDCEHVLSHEEITEFRNSEIILPNE